VYCEICGKKTENLYLVLVGKAKLNVCESCKFIGKEIEKFPKPKVQIPKIEKRIKTPKPLKEEISYVIREDYNLVIKNARERNGMSQDMLAAIVGEKLSTIKKIESGKIKPTLDLAKKIEKALKINLIEIEKQEKVELKGKKDELTLGDILEFKE